MPKSGRAQGGLFSEVDRLGGSVPGPEKYHQEIFNRSFVKTARGGHFSKVKREWGKMRTTMPAVGSYDPETAKDKASPRIPGGRMSKTERKCAFLEHASRSNIPEPGKYDVKEFRTHLQSPVFSSPRTQSRLPAKPAPLGPGHYSPSYSTIEKSSPVYSGSKRAAQSYLDQLIGKKDTTPAPGHVDLKFSHVEDRSGKAMHTSRLLLDRQITPRGIDIAR